MRFTLIYILSLLEKVSPLDVIVDTCCLHWYFLVLLGFTSAALFSLPALRTLDKITNLNLSAAFLVDSIDFPALEVVKKVGAQDSFWLIDESVHVIAVDSCCDKWLSFHVVSTFYHEQTLENES